MAASKVSGPVLSDCPACDAPDVGTPNVGPVVGELKAGKVEYRLDRFANVHCSVGKRSFTEDALAENVQTLLNALLKARPSSAKGIYMKSISVSSTMGPGLTVDLSSVSG